MKDAGGNTHNKFQQYYKGIKIVGAECIVHEQKGLTKSLNGRWVTDLKVNITPGLSERQAFQQALTHIASKDYLWEHKDAKLFEAAIKQKDISLNPREKLVLCRKDWNGDFDANNIKLAWQFDLLVNPMSASHTVYIDANTGNLLQKISLEKNSCHIASGATTWYGTRSFPSTWRGWPDNAYHLDNSDGSCDGRSRISSRRGDPIIPYNYGDGDNSFFDADGVNGYNQKAGVTTYWSLLNAYDFYRYQLGRLSYDGANGGLNAYSEMTGGAFLSSPDNASWNPVYHSMQFGAHFNNSPSDDWNGIDIVGHEITHGVVQFTADLVYSYESGALDESFADIFGTLIDYYGTGVLDWLIGEDRGAFRNMANPNNFGDPDTYGGSFWATGSGDFGGVHTNSGVQNFWFYLLSTGGSGTNDLGRAYNVSALGSIKARNIA